MSKKLFITGTGTDIGKTFVTGLLVKKLNEFGLNPAYYKAAMSGNERDEQGILIPGDAMFVKNISGVTQPLDEMCPYVYEHAYSPHLASQIEGNPVDINIVKRGFYAVADKYDYVLVEGSGGILCPLRHDNITLQLEDVVRELKLPSLIIADAGLGTINSVVLTVFYMREKGYDIKGIIFNHFHKGNILEEDNLKMCEEMTGLKVLACVEDDATDIEIDINILKNLFDDTSKE